MDDLPLYVVVTVAGYLLGSIPSGQLVARLAGGIDLSTRGSGKTGVTNVLRTLGLGAAAVVLLGDLAKGVLAVLLARWLVHPVGAQHVAEALAGFAAVLGHNWSLYIKLKGGRGVVVSQAVFLLFCWPAALIATAFFVIVLALSRFVSLAATSTTFSACSLEPSASSGSARRAPLTRAPRRPPLPGTRRRCGRRPRRGDRG